MLHHRRDCRLSLYSNCRWHCVPGSKSATRRRRSSRPAAAQLEAYRGGCRSSHPRRLSWTVSRPRAPPTRRRLESWRRLRPRRGYVALIQSTACTCMPETASTRSRTPSNLCRARTMIEHQGERLFGIRVGKRQPFSSALGYALQQSMRESVVLFF